MSRINSSVDTLSVALLKKATNHSFSKKTAKKLVCVANRDVQLCSAVGESIFLNRTPIEGRNVNKDAVNALRVALQDCLKNVTNEYARAQFNTWLANCKTMLSIEQPKGFNSTIQPKVAENRGGVDRLGLLRQQYGEPEFLASGSYGSVLKLGDHVIKQFRQVDEGAMLHELKMCNAYREAVGKHPGSASLVGGQLIMPYIEGRQPTDDEVKMAVKSLYEQGFMIGDAQPGNFKVTGDGVVPIDFGQVIKVDDYQTLHKSVGYSIVHDYLRGGYKYVVDELKAEYIKMFNALDYSLGMESPCRTANIKQLRNVQ